MNYWLMKSEPDTFGIEDLAQRPKQTEPWNGVRNFKVRNWLRDTMKAGDKAFFYHSSCKIPGIVGTMKIVTAGYPDSSAMDKRSPYFDPRSTLQKPLWYQIDVQLIKQFKRIISLQELRELPQLKSLLILQKGNRLSITPITKEEWEIINKLPGI